MPVNTYIGFDMSKHSLDACFGDSFPVRTYPNTKKGTASFFLSIAALSQKAGNVFIGFESTCHYHLLLAMRAKEKGFHPIPINPLITHNYSQTNLRKAKTDK